VCTIAAGIVRTIIQPIPQTAQLFEQLLNFLFEQKNTIPKGLNSYNFDAGLDYENTTGSERLQAAELSRQKPSASPRQIY